MAQHEHELHETKHDASSSSTSEPKPSVKPDMSNKTVIPSTSWFTPKRLLAMFCVISFINYLDLAMVLMEVQELAPKGGTCTPGTGIQ
ncbi:hypothetical protein TanjilG_26041 [Lupinus angustifolius]|uniref:Major facilitator superfamily (MFS) profile domain-containing protein n=1 Tax=Lupinus angustifolius TaxID=3871 RepID=A0A1J7GLZ9_LUPAN|nr:hypothetical protein TanjilG_26041 [Lupinus angustifolius]